MLRYRELHIFHLTLNQYLKMQVRLYINSHVIQLPATISYIQYREIQNTTEILNG